MAKLCCSNKNFRIESGRRDITPLELRYYCRCNTQEVENELHFLVECCTYDFQCKKIFEMAENELKSFSAINPKQKFIYHKSSIKPPGGLFDFGPSRRGLNGEGVYSRNQATKDIFGSFSVLLSHILQNQHTILWLKYVNLTQFLSQTILKLSFCISRGA